ncbi:hypothetical protein ABI59_16725 [Acidobacteria bacterium Mor1]|nr:hypothetical protein ABI59_16725 [Acidobacteria bacterium Mor1]
MRNQLAMILPMLLVFATASPWAGDAPTSRCDQGTVLVSAEPGWTLPGALPWPTSVLCVDRDGALTVIERLEQHVSSVEAHPEHDLIAISIGNGAVDSVLLRHGPDLGRRTQLQLAAPDSILLKARPLVSRGGPVGLELTRVDAVTYQSQVELRWLSAPSRPVSPPPTLANGEISVEIRGPGRSQDLDKIQLDASGRLIGLEGADWKFGSHTPYPSRHRESPRGWNLVTLDPGFLVMQRVPYRTGLETTLTAVLDRDSGIWHEFEVTGNYTWLRRYGDWLAGQVRWMHPSADFELNTTGPPVGTDRFIFYELETGRRIEVELGVEADVLHLEDNQLLYRIDDAIFSAELSYDGVENVQELVRDKALRHVHWGFTVD